MVNERKTTGEDSTFIDKLREDRRLREKSTSEEYSRFWRDFNSRKQEALEFSKKRKPMSEATKQKISRSVAKSKGSTTGYDDSNKEDIIDKTERFTNAIGPILRYISEREKLNERRKRRQLASVNSAFYGVRTGNKVANYFTLSPAEKAKQKVRIERYRELGSRADKKLALDTKKLGSFERQTKSQRMEVLRKMEVDRKSQEWQDLFSL
jgi:hypothetical protein